MRTGSPRTEPAAVRVVVGFSQAGHTPRSWEVTGGTASRGSAARPHRLRASDFWPSCPHAAVRTQLSEHAARARPRALETPCPSARRGRCRCRDVLAVSCAVSPAPPGVCCRASTKRRCSYRTARQFLEPRPGALGRRDCLRHARCAVQSCHGVTPKRVQPSRGVQPVAVEASGSREQTAQRRVGEAAATSPSRWRSRPVPRAPARRRPRPPSRPPPRGPAAAPRPPHRHPPAWRRPNHVARSRASPARTRRGRSVVAASGPRRSRDDTTAPVEQRHRQAHLPSAPAQPSPPHDHVPPPFVASDRHERFARSRNR